MSVSSGGARRLPGHRNRLQQQQQQGNIGQRSQSLSALQQPVIQPRMAQLETLEAKMASIEVSLSSATPRRKKCLPLSSPTPRSLLFNHNPITTSSTTLPMDQLEGLRNALRDKENIIKNLRGQMSPNNNNIISHNNKEKLNHEDRKHLEERIQRLKQDTETKRHTIKSLKHALDKLDITDNIDIRIQQAELEYQLGREELNLLTLLEETRSAQSRLDDSTINVNNNAGVKRANNGSVHDLVVSMGGCARLLALDVRWKSAEPEFGTAVKPDGGIFIEWCERSTGLKKGDRIVEINGKLLITKNPPTSADLTRLFALCPEPAQLLILRSGSEDVVVQVASSTTTEVSSLRSELGLVRERAEEAQRAKDGLRADNLRLTHRISYLEEQVSELLESRRHRHHHRYHQQQPEQQIRVVTATAAVHSNQNVTNINIGNGDVQVFQKGPQVTALVPEEQITRSSRRRTDARSVKSLELDSDSYTTTSSPRPRKSLDYTSEPLAPLLRKRPTPPKKPVRLSLHRAQSLQSVDPQQQLQPQQPTFNIVPETRKRSREKTISGLRWPQTQQSHHQHKQTARWC